MRVFVGIELSEEAIGELISVQNQIKPYIDRGSLTEQRNFHLTLRFIGEINRDLLKLLIDAVSDTAHLFSGFDLDLGELGCFQKKNRKIIWAGVGDGINKLNELHDLLNKELKLVGIHPDEQAFHPHITLGRQIKLLDTVQDLKGRYPINSKRSTINYLTVFESKRVNDELTYVPIKRLELQSKRG